MAIERVQKSFRLAADVDGILERVSARDGVSQTAIVEDAVRLAHDDAAVGAEAVRAQIARLRAVLQRLEAATATLPA